MHGRYAEKQATRLLPRTTIICAAVRVASYSQCANSAWDSGSTLMKLQVAAALVAATVLGFGTTSANAINKPASLPQVTKQVQ
jgi:hypothetical protein